MGALDQFSPGQKQALMIGAPVVAVFALVSVIGKRNQPQALPAQTGSDSAIGVGQLAEFESSLAGGIGELQYGLAGLTDKVSNLPDKTAAAVAGAIPSSPAPRALPPIDHSAFPLVGDPGASFLEIGLAGPGGHYSGQNVGGGVPVYALINGQKVQNFDPRHLAANTPLFIPSQFVDYLAPGTISEVLG